MSPGMETLGAGDGHPGSVAQASPVDVAVVWVEKARKGRCQWVDSCSQSQFRAYRIRKRLKPLTDAVKYLLLLLAVFEAPSWCAHERGRCPGPARPDLYGSGAPYLPPLAADAAAAGLWLCLLASLLLRRAALGRAHTCGPWHAAGLACALVALADSVVGACNVSGLIPGRFRLSRLLRPLAFLFLTSSLREAAGRVVHSMVRFVDAFVALALCLFLFVWIGILLFGEEPGGAFSFRTWSDAFANMWILFTTANCPDAFVTIYTRHRLSIFYFVAYILISLYLLNNILLAFIYDSYKEELKEMVKTFDTNQQAAIDHAFALLANSHGVITPDTWVLFFTRCMNEAGSTHDEFNKQRATGVFQTLDTDESRGLSPAEFQLVLSVLHCDKEYIPVTRLPEVAWAKGLQRLFTVGLTLGGRRVPWDNIVDLVVFIGVVLAFVQTALYVSQGVFYERALASKNAWFGVLFAFTSFYVVEVTLKFWAWGLERFWHRSTFINRFDFVNVYGLFIAEVLCLSLHSDAHNMGPKLVVLLHIARSLRLLRHVRPLQLIADLVVRLAPTYWRMGMLLLLVYYTYTTIGVFAFGGLVYRSNPALSASSYAEAEYWPFNFNDFNSGMISLFVIMVVNNWFVFTAAFIRVSGTRWAAGFFVSFFVVTNLIVLNILIALILDCSATLRGEIDGEQAQERPEGGDGQQYDYVSMVRRALLEHEDLGHDVGGTPRSASSKDFPTYGAAA